MNAEETAADSTGHQFPVTGEEVLQVEDLVARIVMAIKPRRPPVEASPGASGPTLPNTPLQVRTLMHLQHRGGMTVGQLAETLGISLGWASRVADELTGGGLVLRERDDQDRRVVHLRLSAEARAFGDRLHEVFGAAWGRALAEISHDERAVLLRFLTRAALEFERLEPRREALFRDLAAGSCPTPISKPEPSR